MGSVILETWLSILMTLATTSVVTNAYDKIKGKFKMGKSSWKCLLWRKNKNLKNYFYQGFMLCWIPHNSIVCGRIWHFFLVRSQGVGPNSLPLTKVLAWPGPRCASNEFRTPHSTQKLLQAKVCQYGTQVGNWATIHGFRILKYFLCVQWRLWDYDLQRYANYPTSLPLGGS